MNKKNVIFGINGPIVTLKNVSELAVSEMVYVGKENLVGEVISVSKNLTLVQVYEGTFGLAPGDEVVGTGHAMSVDLAPGIVGNIFDGIQRPLKKLRELSGSFLPHGCLISSLDEEKLWHVKIIVQCEQKVSEGFVFAKCMETSIIEHRFLVPKGVSGRVIWAEKEGKFNIGKKVVSIKNEEGKIIELGLKQRWPIRIPRPVEKKLKTNIPLVTGQRIIDTLFPIPKGGAAVVPGGFGTGKTMIQHQLAKWCDADVIVYVGCGERGNEMTQVLEEFSTLVDPKSNKPMTERTIFIANTSNMPVASREASIYTGVTIAEYYRDMGYNVAMMADSTSRWAEALREISARLEEMPAEEGFPAYLPSRLSEFYERAGRVRTLGKMEGSVTLIGAVSPKSSDFSEPVTQNSKRFVGCFWALDRNLAYSRHYPAVNWISSYSEYFADLDPWFAENLGKEFIEYRKKISMILREEERLMEIVNLVGQDVLPDNQRLLIETAKLVRVAFLQQSAFNKFDTYVTLRKQKLMMKLILHLNEKVKNLIYVSIPFQRILEIGIFEKLARIKFEIPDDKKETFDSYESQIDKQLELAVK
ncbi:MAG: V-type ATP synthase subunit A [Oscillospiraceae bacterium]|jgi:V/A-type H+-transporting ATPase subunit A|nr:V-type ATP synthase subunit A [Oscillospiraceae bacterium]